LSDAFEILGKVAHDRGFSAWHSPHVLVAQIVYVILWLFGVAAIAAHHLLGHALSVEMAAAKAALAMVIGGATLSVTYGMAHVCGTLTVMIDWCCCDIVDNMLVSDVAHDWNLMQAVVRKASSAIEKCLFAQGIVMAVAVPMALVDVVGDGMSRASAIASLPALTVVGAVLYLLLVAATISDKCARVPALINAVNFGQDTNAKRQEVVHYIISSAAGFYVFGIRLTVAMVLKFAYGWCVIAVGVVTRVITT